MRIWTQNLAEDEGKKHWIWNNRGALYFSGSKRVSWQWVSLQKQSCHLTLEWDMEDGYGLALAIPYLFAIWLHFRIGLPAPPKSGYAFHMYLLGFSIYEEFISLDFWRDTNEMNGHYSLDWKTLLFGKYTYTTEDLGNVEAVLAMPEGNYRAHGKIERATWKRKRFLPARSITRADIDYDPPVPVPGKGENSYDLDDDAIWSITSPYLDENDTIDKMLLRQRDHILAQRIKNGGENWQPDKGWSV